jgi:hypothetical protein
MIKIKAIVFAFCVFSAATALGQATAGASALSSQTQMLQMPDHTAHASQHALATAQSLLPVSEFTYARGERPLWEFAQKTDALPLGDVARMLRKEHASAKKAVMVWDN